MILTIDNGGSHMLSFSLIDTLDLTLGASIYWKNIRNS
jgi:hypothetical protein